MKISAENTKKTCAKSNHSQAAGHKNVAETDKPVSQCGTLRFAVLERKPHPYGYSDVRVDKAAASRLSSGAKQLLSSVPADVPLVLLSYPYPRPHPYSYPHSDDTLRTTNRESPAERIEKEIAECRRRENELQCIKNQRHDMTLEHH